MLSQGTLRLLLIVPSLWAKTGESPGSFPQTSLGVSPAPITAQPVSIVLLLTERGHQSGLQQLGLKPGLVYPVDVLAELLTDL